MDPQQKEFFGPLKKNKKIGPQKEKKKKKKKQTHPQNFFLTPARIFFTAKKNGIVATIRIGPEIQYLPYAEFLKRSGWVRFKLRTFHNPENT